jgi:hypothetical protein
MNLEIEQKYSNNKFFDRNWKNKGIQRPDKTTRCICSQNNLCENNYIFDITKNRLFVVGSECKKKFGIVPKCEVCNTPIKISVAVNRDMMCVECSNKKRLKDKRKKP